MSTALSRLFSRNTATALVCLLIATVTFAFEQHSVAGTVDTHNVEDTGDYPDSNVGDGICSANVPNPRANGNGSQPLCTLRAAIMESNASGGGLATINVPVGNYNLTRDGDDDDADLGDLDITRGVTINGAGDTTIVDATQMQGCGPQRVFSNLAPFNEPVVLNGFTIQEGNAGFGGNCNGNTRQARAAVAAPPYGGGIYNEGELTLTNMTVQQNTAVSAGGGIFSSGSLTVTGTSINGNVVGGCGNAQALGGARAQGTLGNNRVGGGIGSTGALNINGQSSINDNHVLGQLQDNQIPGGRASSSQGGDIGAQGGGVYHSKLGVMSDTLVEDNHVTILNCSINRRDRGSRSAGDGPSTSELAQGGGIYNNAVLTLTEVLVGQETLDQSFSGNTAGRGGGIYNNAGGSEQKVGGAVSGVTMIDSTVQGNLAGLSGGGVHNNGFLDSNNSDIIANRVIGFFVGPFRASPRASGISSNAGGGLFNEGDAIIQNNSLVGDPAPGGFDFVGNSALFGGGIFNSFFADLVVTSSSVDGNSAGQGGGIWNVSTADVVDDSTVSFNTAGAFQQVNKQPSGRATGDVALLGGGIYNESGIRGTRSSGNGAEQFFIKESTLEGNVAQSGGGIANGGSMHISKSTLHHNTAHQEETNGCEICRRPSTRAQGPGPSAVGGGLLNTGSARIDNSTFSANQAEINGGGIYVDLGSLDLLHVTLADNFVDQPQPVSGTGGSPPGGGLVDFGDTSDYQATLFANNTPANCEGSASALNSEGQNLEADTELDATCFLDHPDDFGVVPDALLGPLADNGGPTLTHLPGSNSPAVDRIGGECALSDDQRSQTRPQGGGCEVGAVEMGGGGGPGPGPTPTPVPTGSPSPTPSPTPEPECPGYEGDPRNDVIGTPDADVLDGTSSDDIICGFEGDDILRGFFGNDLLLAGPDDDRTFGGPGDDRIRNSTGNDDSLGGDGDDEVRGGRGEDDIDGGFGNDLLRGYENDDSVSGGPGNDRVLGFPGDDDLDGGDGNDTVKGGLGSDNLDGGPNNDNCHGGKGQDTIQNCEQGSPRAVAGKRSGV